MGKPLEGVDEEILQDFIVEAGEIIELLSEQLVELEKRPNDHDLLNAIFRGFHTVKGGAGFLSLTNLVTACHGAESVFDTLRNGGRTVDAELMDGILQAYDVISHMFAQVQKMENPDPASQQLLDKLTQLSKPASTHLVAPPVAPSVPNAPQVVPIAEAPKEVSIPETPKAVPIPEAPKPVAVPKPVSEEDGAIDTISDDEFEALLDILHGKGNAPGTIADEHNKIDPTDSDFEEMLQQAEPTATSAQPTTPPVQKIEPINAPVLDLEEMSVPASAVPPVSTPTPPPVNTEPVIPEIESNGDMTDDEFEALLDQLHGVGNAPGSKNDLAAQKPVNAVSSATAPAEDEEKTLIVPVKSTVTTPPPVTDTTVRVETKVLDVIMNMVGELVLARNRLISIGNNQHRQDEELKKVIANLDVITADLQGAVMKTRMQPIKKVFGRFPRVIRDLARSLHKQIELVVVGEETDLDKNLVDALADPMVHLVRNSCDHGIETPEVRRALGKPETGTITLSASQQGDHILLKIIDDGAGMDPDKLRDIAIQKGILDKDTAERLSDTDVLNVIFAPGFSTKEKISDISGRGVGMDVVKTNIAKLNGSLHIDSEKGVGTTIEIRVPLTLAILPTLMVRIGGQTFALPLSAVSEIFYLELNNIRVVDGQSTIIIREKAIPIFFLQDWLMHNKPANYQHPKKGHVVLVQYGNNQHVAFVVDELIGQEEVVIKALDRLLHGTPGIAGATVTSDGGIALIIDIPSLLKAYAKKYVSAHHRGPGKL